MNQNPYIGKDWISKILAFKLYVPHKVKHTTDSSTQTKTKWKFVSTWNWKSFVPYHNWQSQIVTHECLLKNKMKHFALIKIMHNFEMQSYKIRWIHYKIIIEKFIWIIRKHLWRPYVNFIQLKPSSDWTAGRIFQKIFSFGLISSVC